MFIFGYGVGCWFGSRGERGWKRNGRHGIPLQGVRGGLVVTRAALGASCGAGLSCGKDSPRGWAVTEEPGMSGLVGREVAVIDLRDENNRSGVAVRSLPFLVAFYPDRRIVF